MAFWSRWKQRQSQSSQPGSALHIGGSDNPAGMWTDPQTRTSEEWDIPPGMPDKVRKWGQAMFVMCQTTPYVRAPATEIVEALITADVLAQPARQRSIDLVGKKTQELLGRFTQLGMTTLKHIEDGTAQFHYPPGGEWDTPPGMSDQAWKWGQAMFVICQTPPYVRASATGIVDALISADLLAQQARQRSIDLVEKKIQERLGGFTQLGMTTLKHIEDGTAQCVPGGSGAVGADASDPALSVRLAEALAAAGKSQGVEGVANGTTVTFGGTSILVRARFENRFSASGRSVAGIVVDSTIGSAPSLMLGSVGVGRDDEEAVRTALLEWVGVFGVALIRATALRERSPELFKVGPFSVYPGITLIRHSEEGELPWTWTRANHETLLGLLRSTLIGLDPKRVHGLSLVLVVDSTGTIDGECRVDGIVSQPGFLAAQGFAWPRAKAGYMFKQSYILSATEQRVTPSPADGDADHPSTGAKS